MNKVSQTTVAPPPTESLAVVVIIQKKVYLHRERKKGIIPYTAHAIYVFHDELFLITGSSMWEFL